MMNKIEITPTEKLEEAASTARQILGELAAENQGFILLRKSATELPQYLQYVADWTTWLKVMGGIGGSAFLAKFSSLGAEDLYAAIKGALMQRSASDARRIVDAVSATHKGSSSQFSSVFEVRTDGGFSIRLILAGANTKNDETACVLFFAAIDRIRYKVEQIRASETEMVDATCKLDLNNDLILSILTTKKLIEQKVIDL